MSRRRPLRGRRLRYAEVFPLHRVFLCIGFLGTPPPASLFVGSLLLGRRGFFGSRFFGGTRGSFRFCCRGGGFFGIRRLFFRLFRGGFFTDRFGWGGGEFEGEFLAMLAIFQMDQHFAAIDQLAREQAEREKAEAGPADEAAPPAPAPKIKKRKNISIQTVNVSSSWQVETPQDVDKYLDALRDKILRELDEDTVVNIEF